jgi:glycosyltransferase involved in cell wall biosynthesis
MSRIIFLNRFFYPDHSATSQILGDLAFYLADIGRDVHVVTSRQIYDAPATRLEPEETIRGVRVHRVSTTRYGRSGLVGRSMDYLSFYWSVSRYLSGLVKSNDFIVVKTDPPLLSILVAGVARRRSAHLVNWLQDLYPEVAIELKVPLLSGPLGRVIIALRNRSLRSAATNVVLGTSMRARVLACGVPDDLIHIIPNWTDDEVITPVDHAENPFRSLWRLDGKIVIGYSGNLGRVHEYETLIESAEQLRGDPRIVFVLIGGGKQFEQLAAQVQERKLEQAFRFLPYQDREVLRYSLGVPDVHWISTRPELEGLILPSKLYGIAAAGRPLIAITPGDGEIAMLVREHACGLVVKPGDAAGLTQAILRLANEPSTCVDMGRRARAMLEAAFTRKQAFARWEKLLGGR